MKKGKMHHASAQNTDPNGVMNVASTIFHQSVIISIIIMAKPDAEFGIITIELK